MIDYEYVKCLGDIFLDVGLSEKERTYLVRAVLSYEGELSETEQTLDAGIVKQLIRQVLAEEYETAERPVSPSHQAEQEQVLDVSDNHMSDAQSKDLRRSISQNLQSFRGRH